MPVENGTFSGQGVYVRCDGTVVAAASKTVIPLLVGVQDENVTLRFHSLPVYPDCGRCKVLDF